MDVHRPIPSSCLQHERFAKKDEWLLRDLGLSLSGNIIVSGSSSSDRTLIDIYTVKNHFDTRDESKLFYSKEFEKHSSAEEKDHVFLARRASFLDRDGDDVVTCLGDKLQVIKVSKDEVLLSRKLNGEAYCLYLTDKEIFVGFWQSRKIYVYGASDLSELRSITLERIQEGDWPHDITVTRGKIYACVGHADASSNQTAMIFDEESGRRLSEFTHPSGTGWYARSLAVNVPAGIVGIVWNDSFYRIEGEHWQIVFYHLMGENNTSFLKVEIDCGVTRIRISDGGERTVTGNLWTGEVKIYDTSDLFTYDHLKKCLASQLERDDCLKLTNLFAFSEDHADDVLNSSKPTENLLLALEEKDIMHPFNVDRLRAAFLELKIKSSCCLLVDTYQKTRVQATLYSRFLATLSTHLTTSLPEDLCNYFNISDEKKETIMSNHNPGLSLLLALDEMGTISSSEVIALEQPFSELNLVQAVAKIHEYQSIIEERMSRSITATKVAEEGKKALFIQCLKKKIKRWYDAMTPVPWKKSCRWKSTELFIGRNLILTTNKDERNLTDIDEGCKIPCNEMFSHALLKSERRIILEGDPGSGKTMLMSQLAYDWSLGKFSEIETLIVLPLKFVQHKTLAETIHEFYLLEDNGLSMGDVESLLLDEENCCHLLLDGLEEYTGKEFKGEQSEVMRVMSTTKYPHCKVVITSRSDYARNLPECPMLKLSQFGELERNLYIERVFSDNEDKQMEVKAIISNSSFMLDLCSTPLLFVMAVHNITRTQNLLEGQLNNVSPFMRDMIEELCSPMLLKDQSNRQSGVESKNDSQLQGSVLSDETVQPSQDALGREVMEKFDLTHYSHKGHTDESVQHVASEKDAQSGVQVQSSKETLRTIQQSDEHTQELLKGTSQSEKEARSVGEVQSDVQLPSGMEGLLQSETRNDPNTLREDFQKEKFKLKDDTLLSIEDLAFNGLCRRVQQLSWQREFVERKVIGGKTWVACGLLVTEERILTIPSFRSKDFQEKGNEEEAVMEAETLDDHPKDGRDAEHDLLDREMDDECQGAEKVQPKLGKNESGIAERGTKIMTQVSLEVKFLHKLIQEWFAARKLSSLFSKSTSSSYVQDCVNEYMRNISPEDLHYLLRFTCFLCPRSLHFIVKHLLQDLGGRYQSNHIMNCIFLCFAEYNGEETMDLLETVADVCQESIVITSEDSKFLQQAKAAVLERASSNWIPIKQLTLTDVLVSASENEFVLNTGTTITVLDTLEMLDVSRWDQTLQDEYCLPIVKFISNSSSMKEARVYLPYNPPKLDQTTVTNLRKENKTVTWTIGPKMKHRLDTRTGGWPSTSMDSMIFSSNEGYGKKIALSVEGTLSTDGGVLEIPDTCVSLEVPPRAFEEDEHQFLIQMRIIPLDSHMEPPKQFCSNSSAVVELLPNNLRFKHPVKLTIPHCVQFKKDVRQNARVFMSHHEGENKPNWEEMIDAQCEIDDQICTVWLKTFCWVKVEFDNDAVDAKLITIFTAAKPICVPDDIAEIEVGYHLDLPGARPVLSLNESFIIEQRRAYLFLKEGNHPLKVTLHRVISRTWKYSTEESKTKEIPFNNVALSIECSCPFLLEQDEKGCNIPTCIFKVSQNERAIEINIRPQKRRAHIVSSNRGEHESSLQDEFAILLVKMASMLSRKDCISLATYFDFSKEKMDLIARESLTPGISLLCILRERKIIDMYNIMRLQGALKVVELQAIIQTLLIPYQSKIESVTHK